jgi:hypothetical protein
MMKHNLQLELNNDNTYVVSVKNVSYCTKCGKKLDDDKKDFCDRECRREYFAEIQRDLGAFRNI